MALLVKTLKGLAYASVKTCDGLAVGSVKTINGLDATAGGGAFSPSDIAGLKLWCKADALTGLSDGNAVSSFTDQSGNGNHLVQATGGSQPIYKTGIINSLPVLRMDGSKHMAVSFTLAQPATIFVVTDNATVSSNSGVILDGINSFSAGFYIDTIFSFRPFAGSFGSNQTCDFTAPQVTTLKLDTSTGFSAVNGTQMSQGFSNSTLGGITMGRHGGGSFPFNTGDIAEIIVYDSALSTANREAVEDYLGTKYGITITH